MIGIRLRRLILIRANALGWFGIGVCTLFVLLVIFGPLIEPVDANKIGGTAPFLRPPSHYLLGTDELGRSELSRLIIAARVAILSAVESVAIAFVLGTVMGVLAGYFGGWIDEILSRVMDFLFSFPAYLLGILVVVVLGPSLTHAALAIGLVFTPQFGRIARSATESGGSRGYIEVAQACGRSKIWILSRHILPNIMSPLSVMIGLTLSNAEGAYAVLSYLGFGAPPPTPDYGTMLSAAQQYLTTDPWLTFLPAIALVVLIVGFVFLGDWIRDRFDPHSTLSMSSVRAGALHETTVEPVSPGEEILSGAG